MNTTMGSPITQLEQLVVNAKSKDFLSEIARWSFFFAILGFISIAVLLVFAILIGTVYAPIVDAAAGQQGLPSLGISLSITYFIVAIIYVFPVLYLLQFSKKMKAALESKNDDALADAFGMLKSHFKYVGVLTIILISLYVLLIGFYLAVGSLI